MFQRFNENNMLTKFIKNLLSTAYIPSVKVWKPGDSIVNNTFYIADNYIVKAIKSSLTNIDTSNIIPLNSEYFEVIEPYIKGKFYRGISSNYNSNTATYDPDTHYYLGQYLRMIRDLDGINLMPYYNCWDGTYSDKIRINYNLEKWVEEIVEDKNGEDVKIQIPKYTFKVIQNNTLNDGVKVLIVSIKFDTKYTIYLDNNMPTLISPVYYDGINIIPNTELVKQSKLVDRITKNNPYILEPISTSFISDLNDTKEDYLNLLIQLPETNSSAIVVLEGDYSSWKIFKDNRLPKTHYGEALDYNKDGDKLSISQIENYFKSGIDLIHSATNQNYAFSNRLVEYLLLNIIGKDDSISQNISRMQVYAGTNKSSKLNGIKFDRYNSTTGVWDLNLRRYSYDVATSFEMTSEGKKPISFDVNGYIDKDTEAIILRGKE